MPDMKEMTTLTVRGEPDTLPFTWGQRWWWNEFPPESPDRRRGNMIFSLDFPSGMSLTGALEVLADIVGRFDTLRTRYELTGRSVPVQVVERQAHIPVYFYTAEKDSPVLPESIDESMRTHNFDLHGHPPACLAIGLGSEGEPVRLHVFLDHIVTDLAGAVHLKRYFRSVISGEGTPAGPIHQPADQVALESSEARRRRNKKAMEYWRFELKAPAPDAWLSHVAAARSGSALNFSKVSLDSPFLGAALPIIAERHQVSVAHVLCHLAALTFEGFAGIPPHFNMIVSTRRSQAERSALGMYSRSIPISLKTRGRTVDECIRDAARMMMRGQLFAACDPTDFDAVCRETGWPDRAMIGVSLNDGYSATINPSAQPATRRDDLESLLKLSTFEHPHFRVHQNGRALKIDSGKGPAGVFRLSLEVDARLFSASAAEKALGEFEERVLMYLKKSR
ncbi:condensation domain-containing protein [Streptomyces bobili]|uniref:condensation domain-containing protein n=1 Tax=Streptomyces bobili TaxID=67280 RepID=UPI000A35EF00|nr:condensation domain-containing protein [Streptomyces bobili]